ncbi:MAG: glycosyltransferase family 2 protein [Bacteroidales bacterium]|nr:glycosyltransferase family 2 protein [Bacteroidales bacterium]
MTALKILFWVFLFVIIYTYLVYTLILIILNFFNRLLSKKTVYTEDYLPDVTLFITAYNEKEYIEKKLKNSFELNYPKEKLFHLWVTDGSDDGSPEILRNHNIIEVLHQDERKGKTNAMNRGMQYVKTPIVVFSDANTDLNSEAIREIVKLFSNRRVGCVAGEKRIYSSDREKAVSSGEGIYWKYESYIKMLESSVNSTTGAVGELFAIRKELFSEVDEDMILDDFIISLKIAVKGYKLKYAPNAYACENASFSMKEEMKRKIRIASGSFQALTRIPELFNIFKHGLLSFQFISHKVLRWALVPLSFIMIFFTNLLMVLQGCEKMYVFFFLLQLLFYLTVTLGMVIKNKKISLKLLFVPYYLFMMNYSIVLGLIRFLSGKQPPAWEKAKRG